MWASMTFLPKQVWKDNDLWFGAHHDGHECRTGFWGELKDPYERNKKTFCFLGYSTNENLFKFFMKPHAPVLDFELFCLGRH